MPDYRKMYLTLFDAVERTLEVLDAPEQDTALAKDLRGYLRGHRGGVIFHRRAGRVARPYSGITYPPRLSCGGVRSPRLTKRYGITFRRAA